MDEGILDYLNYDKLMDKAMLGVARTVIEQLSQHGLKSNHHFFITFVTNHPGVQVPDYLKEQYPEEMTIVIQHQYENLLVSRDAFSIDLFFEDQEETIKVPFSSLLSIEDPSVNWGLDFEPDTDFSKIDVPSSNIDDTPQLKKEEKGTVVSLDSFRKKDK